MFVGNLSGIITAAIVQIQSFYFSKSVYLFRDTVYNLADGFGLVFAYGNDK
jgi:hypothetical protein